MKNKLFILTAALTMSLCLTACAQSENSHESLQNITSSTKDSSSNVSNESSLSSQSSLSSAGENSKPLPENNFPESFTGYLGETLHGADAAEQLGGTVKFDDFTYLRWAAPIFDNTLKTPDLINWDTYDIIKYDDIISQKQTDPKWFSVKPGDILENGLVVKSASCGFEKTKYFDGTEDILQTRSEVAFENTLTLNGVLYCSPEQDMYIGNGELFFFPDSTANSNIPVINRREKAGEYSLNKYIFSNAAFVCDGIYYRVGDIDSVSVDLSGIIKRGEASEVRITLDNIKLVNDETGMVLSGAYADIVSIEKVNN